MKMRLGKLICAMGLMLFAVAVSVTSIDFSTYGFEKNISINLEKHDMLAEDDTIDFYRN